MINSVSPLRLTPLLTGLTVRFDGGRVMVFLRVWAWPLSSNEVLMSHHTMILANCILLVLWQQFTEGPYLNQHDSQSKIPKDRFD